MNDQPVRGTSAADEPHEARPNRAQITVLRALLVLESAAVIALAVWFLIELITAEPTSFTSALAIFVLIIIAAVFVVAFTVAALRGSSWIRGAAFTWQLVQLAIGFGFVQGEDARPDVGWAIIVPSAVVMVLLLLPGVRAGFARAIDTESDASMSSDR